MYGRELWACVGSERLVTCEQKTMDSYRLVSSLVVLCIAFLIWFELFHCVYIVGLHGYIKELKSPNANQVGSYLERVLLGSVSVFNSNITLVTQAFFNVLAF